MAPKIQKAKYQYQVRCALSPDSELLFKSLCHRMKMPSTKLARKIIEEYCTQQLAASVPEVVASPVNGPESA